MKQPITYIEDIADTDTMSEKLRINLEQKDTVKYGSQTEIRDHLILNSTVLEIDVPDIDQYVNQDYALLRKNGLGASDASSVLGVNPFTNRQELIAEKQRDYLTKEEEAVGDKAAVKKGRDLEPIILDKFKKYLGDDIIKPVDMYRVKDFPYLKINYDGVTGHPDQYIPAEIKVVTIYGEKHYNLAKAWFSEINGFGPIPEDPSKENWSIETKAGYYGIPPYYYTQLQQEMLGLNAPFGYLTVLNDRTWEIYSFYIWRDEPVINAIITEGYKVWRQIESGRGVGWHIVLKGLEAL